jgi:hypothetical protein
MFIERLSVKKNTPTRIATTPEHDGDLAALWTRRDGARHHAVPTATPAHDPAQDRDRHDRSRR